MSEDFMNNAQIRNSRNAFASTNGILITDIQEGKAVVEMEVSAKHMNPIGSLHGGCLFTAADVAAGTAVASYGRLCTTLNCSFSYLRPGLQTKKVIATGKVIKRGKRVMVAESVLTDQDGRELCSGTFTYMPVFDDPEAEKAWLEKRRAEEEAKQKTQAAEETGES